MKESVRTTKAVSVTLPKELVTLIEAHCTPEGMLRPSKGAMSDFLTQAAKKLLEELYNVPFLELQIASLEEDFEIKSFRNQ